MKRKSATKIAVFSVVLILFGASTAIAAPAQTADEKRKCDELLKDKDASPDLFTEVLNCDLNVEEETFAAAGGFGVDSEFTRQLITGGDITLTSFEEDPTDPTPPPPPGPTCGAGTGVPCPKLP